MATIAPCAKCDKRFLGCHSLCVEYKEWADNKILENKRAREANRLSHEDEKRLPHPNNYWRR